MALGSSSETDFMLRDCGESVTIGSESGYGVLEFVDVTESDGVERVEAEVRAAAAAGLPASLVTETGLPFPVAAAAAWRMLHDGRMSHSIWSTGDARWSRSPTG